MCGGYDYDDDQSRFESYQELPMDEIVVNGGTYSPSDAIDRFQQEQLINYLSENNIIDDYSTDDNSMDGYSISVEGVVLGPWSAEQCAAMQESIDDLVASSAILAAAAGGTALVPGGQIPAVAMGIASAAGGYAAYVADQEYDERC